MLCISGFELYSRWVPLNSKIKILKTIHDISFFKLSLLFVIFNYDGGKICSLFTNQICEVGYLHRAPDESWTG